MDKLELKALAKINLGLDVLGRRDNGYHDVKMVMQTIYLYDDVILRKTKESGIQLATNLTYLPVDEHNIAYKAAKLLQEEFDLQEGISIYLKKRIPVSAGMAGGSTNAATVLFGMNRMFGLGLSVEELMERGVKLGADVPYCVMRGTVLAEGIGEILTPLSPMPKCAVLIAKPGISVSTKTVYEKFDALSAVEHPNMDGLVQGLEEGDLQKIGACMGNVLETVTIEKYPILSQIKNIMKREGALQAMMSGSGPTIFGIFEDRKTAKRAYRALREKNMAKQIYLTGVHNTGRRA